MAAGLAVAALFVLSLAGGACGEDASPTTPESPSPKRPVRGALERISPKRPLLVIQSELGRRGKTDLVSLASDETFMRLIGESSKPRLIPSTCCSPQPSSDGQRIYFTRELRKRDEDAIYVLDIARSHLQRLTHDGSSEGPVLARNDDLIAYTRRTGGRRPDFDFQDGAEVWIMNADGTGQRRLVDDEPRVFWIPGSFSPDGSIIALTRATVNRQLVVRSSIWTVGVDGTGLERLSPIGAEPRFSPDGAKIAFSTDHDRNGEICFGDRCSPANELYVMNADGSAAQRITETEDVGETHPAWSPDGMRIAYERGIRTGNAEAGAIFVLNPDGSCRTAVAQRANVWYRAPGWVPEAAPGPLHC
jgi:Tol biopolymer transport system component